MKVKQHCLNVMFGVASQAACAIMYPCSNHYRSDEVSDAADQPPHTMPPSYSASLTVPASNHEVVAAFGGLYQSRDILRIV
jgi:hypothetical protein